jgi:hypothetical protein
MRYATSSFLALSILLSACSTETVTPSAETTEKETPAHIASLSALLQRTTPTNGTVLTEVLAACQPARLLDQDKQDSYALIAATQREDGQINLSMGQWTAEDAMQRDFTLTPGKGALRVRDGALAIVAEYADTKAYGYMLDKNGDVTFAGPPPIEFPHALACADPAAAVKALEKAGLSDFVSDGPTADDYFLDYIRSIEPGSDPRFAPALDACGSDGDAWLLDASFIDQPTMAYQNTIQVTIAQRYSDGFGTTTLFIPPDQFSLIWGEEDNELRIRSVAAGFTKDFSDQGPSSESNDFEEAEVDITFTCADRWLATSVFGGVNRWRAEGRSGPLPVSFAVDVDNQGLSCNLSAANLALDLQRSAWAVGLQPRLDYSAPDLRVVATAARESADSKLGCEYRALITGPTLSEPIDPLPARAQNYETGTEVVGQGFTQALERLWDAQAQ